MIELWLYKKIKKHILFLVVYAFFYIKYQGRC